MKKIEAGRHAARVSAYGVALVAIVMAACDYGEPLGNTDPEPEHPARVIGLVEVTINGIGTDNMTSSVISAPDFATLELLRAERTGTGSPFSSVISVPTNADLSGDGTIQLDPVSTGSFTTGARGAGGLRYLQAVFRVRNAPSGGGAGYDTPRQNLTFLGVDTDGTLGETAISQLATFGGTAINGAAGIALAETMLPTGAAARSAEGELTADYADVLQVITEAEAAAVDLTGSPDVNTVFPYGFITRCVSNCSPPARVLPASPAVGQFDGIVTFAFKVPLQATAADDPYSISVVFLAVDDTDTRITESPEDLLSGTAALQTAAAALGNATVTLLGTSTTNVPVVDMRRICTVRTAGLDPFNPVATLVDAGVACTSGLAATVRAVDADAAPGGDGTSWGTAFNTLQDALECVRSDAACAGVNELWVAEGIYYTDEGGLATDGDATSRFGLIEGLSVYGGFAGSEYSRDQRDWEVRTTILSGDIDQDDAGLIAATPADIAGTNSPVIIADGTVTPITSVTVLDGFTITAGSSPDAVGGMRCDGSGGECSPTMRNLVFSGNRSTTGAFSTGGLGIFALTGGTASPRIENVEFTGNQGEDAGGVFTQASGGATVSPALIRVTFSTNGGAVSAFRTQAGATSTSEAVIHSSTFRDNDVAGSIYTLYSSGASPFVINSEFFDNVQLAGGATLAFQAGSGIVTNSTIAGNTSAVLTSATTLALNNMIVWTNGATSFSNPGGASTVSINTSIIQGGCPGIGGYTCTSVASADPQFVNQAGGDLQLGGSSPAIDVGNNSLLPPDTFDVDGDGNTAELLPLDIGGNARVADWGGDDAIDLVDLGAWERQP